MTLKISNLSKTYSNGINALDEVNLKIHTGMFGLLGPNGAGKSTLMRILATLQEPDKGEISFSGIDLIKKKMLIRKRLGYLPQEFGVYPKVSVFALLDHLAVLNGLLDKKQRNKRVIELLELTNLQDTHSQTLKGFSGGMKQRFGIAQALLGNPELLIVDEPTAGLDPEERIRFHNLLSHLSEDIVVILSSHIVTDISDLCANLAIINQGKVLFCGKTKNIVDSIDGKIWKKVISHQELALNKEKYQFISSQILDGRTNIKVFNGSPPDKTFERINPCLEDAYFAVTHGFIHSSVHDKI